MNTQKLWWSTLLTWGTGIHEQMYNRTRYLSDAEKLASSCQFSHIMDTYFFFFFFPFYFIFSFLFFYGGGVDFFNTYSYIHYKKYFPSCFATVLWNVITNQNRTCTSPMLAHFWFTGADLQGGSNSGSIHSHNIIEVISPHTHYIDCYTDLAWQL